MMKLVLCTMVMHLLVIKCPSANLLNVCAILEETIAIKNVIIIAAVKVQIIICALLTELCVHYHWALQTKRCVRY